MAAKKKTKTKIIVLKPKTTKRAGGGSKLARTEIVQVRLDPKLRFAAELASKKHRKTLSSFIEWCVSESIHRVWMDPKENETAYDVMSKLWSTYEFCRFINLATQYPHLLTHEEEQLFDLMDELRIHWITKSDQAKGYSLYYDSGKIYTDYLEYFFKPFKDVIGGELDDVALICMMERFKTKTKTKFAFPGEEFDVQEFQFSLKEIDQLLEDYGCKI